MGNNAQKNKNMAKRLLTARVFLNPAMNLNMDCINGKDNYSII